MNHAERVRLFLTELPRPGLGRWFGAPPIYRLAWFFGARVRPPVFASYRVNAIGTGVFFALFWILWMWFFVWADDLSALVIGTALSIPLGAFVGISTARSYRDAATRLGLGAWEDFSGFERADSPEGGDADAANPNGR